jgi:hypothetical protein
MRASPSEARPASRSDASERQRGESISPVLKAMCVDQPERSDVLKAV